MLDKAKILNLIEVFNDYEPNARESDFLWQKVWITKKSQTLKTLLWCKSCNLAKIPGLYKNKLFGLFLKGDRVTIKTSADAALVSDNGNRLRAFYVSEGKTLKIVRKDSFYGEEIFKEFELREEIAKKSKILMPEMGEIKEQGEFIYLTEKLIEGRRYSVKRDKALFCSKIITPLIEFYSSMGMEKMPLKDALDDMTEFAYANKDKVNPKLMELIEKNPEISVSLCHNDVLSSNLAVSGDDVYFLDWGSAIKTICGRDFVRMGVRYLDDKDIYGFMDSKIKELQDDVLDLEYMLMIQKLWEEFVEFNQNSRIYSGIKL